MTTPGWTADVLTLFPEMFPGPLGMSVVGRSLRQGLWQLHTTQIRDFATDAHRTVDDTPYGGGPGMVLRPDVVDAALVDVHRRAPSTRLVYVTPRGQPFDQSTARALAGAPHVTFLCGHYEGIDQRVIDHWQPHEISLGDFILSGGELAVMAMLDAIVRTLPGALGSEASLNEESFDDHLLEYPHFTRPHLWKGREVPEVLLSGHHQRIQTWRQERAHAITQERRPDLWARRAHEAPTDTFSKRSLEKSKTTC